MKHLEVTFTNLTFGNLADLTVSKFNKVHEKLDFWSDDELVAYQRMHQNVREEHHREEEEQAHFRLQEAERQLALVSYKLKINVIRHLIFPQETAKFDEIDKAARSLVYLTAYHPKSDMTDFEEKRIQFNGTRPKGHKLRQK